MKTNRMRAIANWWKVSRRHLLVYGGLLLVAIAGSAIKNCLAQGAPTPVHCRVSIERFPSVVTPATNATNSEVEPGLQGLLMELREGRH